MGIKMVVLGSVLKQYRIEHIVQDDRLYKQVTISKYGGVSLRGESFGKNIGRKRQFIIDLKNYPNTLLFIRQGVQEGGIGLAPNEVDGCIVTENMPMFSVQNINPKYLEYYLKSAPFRNQVNKLVAVGSAQKALHEKELLKVEIPLPAPGIQDLIVKRINNIWQLNDKLDYELGQASLHIEQLYQAILREAAQGKLIKQVPNDEPAEKLLMRIKAEKSKLTQEGNGRREKELLPFSQDETPYTLPKGWAWCRLGEIVNPRSGVTLGKKYKDNLVQVPYLRVANVQRGSVDLSHVKEISVPATEIEKYALRTNDLIMIEGGDWDKVGRCAIWNGEITPCIHQNHIFRLRFPKEVLVEWAELFLNGPIARRYFESCSKQTTNLASINQTQLKNALFPLPSTKEQKRIIDTAYRILEQVRQLELQCRQQKAQSQELLQSVLTEAFSHASMQQHQLDSAIPLVAKPEATIQQSTTQKKTNNFPEVQAVWYWLRAKSNQNNPIYYGQMALAKELYLVDRLYDVKTGFNFVNWHWGPYDPKMKEIVFAKTKYFIQQGTQGRQTINIDTSKADKIEKYNFPYKNELETAAAELHSLFAKYPAKERTHKIELLATVAKCIEDTKSTELSAIRSAMANWPINDKSVSFKNKAEKFTEKETSDCIKFIINKEWHHKLIGRVAA